jgi:PAS domain S-box-containing protein
MIKSDSIYNKMIEEIEDYAILLLDIKGNVMNWNKGAEKIKGYKQEEIIGKNFNLFYTEEDRERGLPEKLIKEAGKSGKAIDEGWRVRKDGLRFWGSILITAIHDENNKVVGFSKATCDLTEKRNTDKKVLAQTRKGLLKVFNASPSGMIITDIESRRYVEINKNFLATFGYTREEVIGLTPDALGIVSKEGRERLAFVLSNQGYLKNESILCKSKEGKQIECIVSADMFEMDDKKYFLSIYHDVTESKKAEKTKKALVQTQEGLLKIFNASPSGMIIADIESGRIINANESFLTTFGYTLEETIGLTADELGFVSKETQAKSFGKLKRQGYLKNEHVPGRTKKGIKIDTIFSVELFEMEGKKCFLCIIHDITQMKEMEKKLVVSEAKYRTIIEEAGDVLYTANAQGSFTYINKRVSKLTGYTAEELIGKHFSVLIAPEWQEKVRRSYQEQFKHRINETIMEFVIHTKTGQEKWVEQVVVMQMESTGIFIKEFQCIVRDISERKKAIHLLAKQKMIIEQKNKDILDSISYAKRIQDAIFPPEALVKELLPQSFVLFKPKDIISGDFYWVEKFHNKTYIAAVDCTGHGVPGALLSIVGYNLLSKAINEHDLTNPNEILNELSTGINQTLRQNIDGSGIKDTMDIALCSIDRVTNKLEFAGAYNSLYLVRDGKLIEIRANRFPVGVFLRGAVQKFTNNQMQLQKGDMIYLFSDGYADQFGGPKGKKLKYNEFRKLLLSLHNLPVKEQKEALNKNLEEWKWITEEQTDDILVIGIRI